MRLMWAWTLFIMKAEQATIAMCRCFVCFGIQRSFVCCDRILENFCPESFVSCIREFVTKKCFFKTSMTFSKQARMYYGSVTGAHAASQWRHTPSVASRQPEDVAGCISERLQFQFPALKRNCTVVNLVYHHNRVTVRGRERRWSALQPAVIFSDQR